MNWTEFLRAEVESTYTATEGLMSLVPSNRLDWKPDVGDNWMTVGQLLRHLTTACGFCCKGLVTGDWGEYAAEIEKAGDAPEGEDPFLPPAEALPTIDTVDEARRLLAEDKALALAMIDQVGEDELREGTMKAPWDPRERRTGAYLHETIAHLGSHRAQLFYYLKLLDLPVNTAHLWGMPNA